MDTQRITLMLADDHAPFRKKIAAEMMQTPDIDLIGEATDGMNALEQMGEKLPDVLVLDSVLPKLDGMGVIRHIRSMALEKTPHVILLTYPGQTYLETMALKLGADMCLEKQVDPAQLCECIRFCMTRQPCCISEESTEGYAEAIREILARIRMGTHLDGYDYLCYGVPLVCMDGTLMRGVTTRIYPMIAQQFDTNGKRVERSIRHAIETTFNVGDYRAIYEVFGNTIDPQRGKPTNGEFIALLAETARLRVRRKMWKNNGC